MCSGRRKNHSCGQKKTECTSSAIFGFGTASKCCKLKRCADRVRSRTWPFRLPLKRQLLIVLNFFFPFIDIRYFFSRLKLQHCQTNVLLNELKLFNETSFSKETMVTGFPVKKSAGCPKAPRDFPPRKDGILLPPSGYLGTPFPLPQSLYVRTGGRAYADIRTKISCIDRLPDLLSLGALLCGLRRQRSSAIIIISTY